jgi:hypothetical protein
MRCMTCGDQMVSGEVIPADAGLVQGFKNITLRCPGCGDTESRFVFANGATTVSNRAAEVAKAASPSDHTFSSDSARHSRDSQHNKAASLGAEKELSTADLPAQSTPAIPEKITVRSKPRITQRATPTRISGASAQSWGRAVERLRIHQADLQQRADKAKRESLTIGFNKAWDGLTAPNRQNRWTAKLRDDSARLAEQALTFAGTRHVPAAQRAIAADRKPARCFDQFWDSLVPGNNGVPKFLEPSVAPSLAPLPRSLSLVVIEPNDTRNVLPHKSDSKRKLQKLFNSLRHAVR